MKTMLDFSKCVLNVGAGFDSMPFVHHSRRFAELNTWAKAFSAPTVFIFVDSFKFYHGPDSGIQDLLKKRLEYEDSRTKVDILSIENFDYLVEFDIELNHSRAFRQRPISFLLQVRLTEIASNITEDFDLVYIVGKNHDVLHHIITLSPKITVAHFRARRDRGDPRVFTEFCRNPRPLLSRGFRPETLFTSFENRDEIAELATNHPITLVASTALKNAYGTPCRWYSVKSWLEDSENVAEISRSPGWDGSAGR